MIRFWSTALVGLALAGIIHVVALQLIPFLTPQLARDRLAALGEMLKFHEVGPETGIPDLDPAFRYAICLFDLGDGEVAVDAAPGGDYWGLSFHDRYGAVFYALNNRSTELGRLTLVVTPQAEAARLSRTVRERDEDAVVVGAPSDRGYVVFRTMVSAPSREAEAAARIERARCRHWQPANPTLKPGMVPSPVLRKDGLRGHGES